MASQTEEFMKKHMEESNKGHSKTMTPGAHSGPDMPTQSSGRTQGQETKKSPNPGQGQKKPASSGKGNGAHKKSVLPNKGKAGASVKGKPSHGLPSMNSVAKMLSGSGPHGNVAIPDQGGPSILSHFGGFDNAQ